MSWRAKGMRPWVLQRFSAVYIALYCLAMMIFLLADLPDDFLAWRGLFSHPVMNIATLLFLFGLLAHAWVGVRDILVDYVHSMPVRLILISGLSMLQICLAIWVSMLMFSVVRL